MKKFFLTLLVLVFHTVYSQEYHFDYMIKYSTKSGNTTERTIYSNSQDSNIHLMIGGFNGASNATILDNNKNIVYTFKVKKKKVNDEIVYTFKFISKKAFQLPEFYANYDFKFETLESDELYKKVKLTVYSDASRKNEIATHVLNLKKSDINLFSAFRVSCLHPFESFSKLILPGNYIVESGTGSSKGGFIRNSKLITSKSTQLTIVAPKYKRI